MENSGDFLYNNKVLPLNEVSLEVGLLLLLVLGGCLLLSRQLFMPASFYERENKRARLRIINLDAEAYARFKQQRQQSRSESAD